MSLRAIIFAVACVPMWAAAAPTWEWEGHTYRLITKPKTWEQAVVGAESQSLGGQPGYLVRIDSGRENQVILEKVLELTNKSQRQNSIPNDDSGVSFFWLGI